MELEDVCPKRRAIHGPRPKLTGCGMVENKAQRHEPWIFPDISELGEETKRKMIVEAMRIVLKELLETHAYEFATTTEGWTRMEASKTNVFLKLSIHYWNLFTRF